MAKRDNTNYCDSILGGCTIPANYWNPGMEHTRGFLHNGFCRINSRPLSIADNGVNTTFGCWENQAAKEGVKFPPQTDDYDSN